MSEFFFLRSLFFFILSHALSLTHKKNSPLHGDLLARLIDDQAVFGGEEGGLGGGGGGEGGCGGFRQRRFFVFLLFFENGGQEKGREKRSLFFLPTSRSRYSPAE